jgi:hypothetical protein
MRVCHAKIKINLGGDMRKPLIILVAFVLFGLSLTSCKSKSGKDPFAFRDYSLLDMDIGKNRIPASDFNKLHPNLFPTPTPTLLDIDKNRIPASYLDKLQPIHPTNLFPTRPPLSFDIGLKKRADDSNLRILCTDDSLKKLVDDLKKRSNCAGSGGNPR